MSYARHLFAFIEVTILQDGRKWILGKEGPRWADIEGECRRKVLCRAVTVAKVAVAGGLSDVKHVLHRRVPGVLACNLTHATVCITTLARPFSWLDWFRICNSSALNRPGLTETSGLDLRVLKRYAIAPRACV